MIRLMDLYDIMNSNLELGLFVDGDYYFADSGTFGELMRVLRENHIDANGILVNYVSISGTDITIECTKKKGY